MQALQPDEYDAILDILDALGASVGTAAVPTVRQILADAVLACRPTPLIGHIEADLRAIAAADEGTLARLCALCRKERLRLEEDPYGTAVFPTDRLLDPWHRARRAIDGDPQGRALREAAAAALALPSPASRRARTERQAALSVLADWLAEHDVAVPPWQLEDLATDRGPTLPDRHLQHRMASAAATVTLPTSDASDLAGWCDHLLDVLPSEGHPSLRRILALGAP